VRALDGLRGVAALVVLFHHALLTLPAWASVYANGYGPKIEFTPVHTLVDGTFAVYVFFVLSGVVLARLVQDGDCSWRAYYGKRLLRLYVPVWAAIVFAIAIYFAVPRRHVGSWWVAAHAGALGHAELFHDATLTNTGWINSVLWSLKWEVIFSLLLPVYVFCARRLVGFWLPGLATLVAISVVGARTGHGSAQYLPMFGVGVLVCQNWQRLPRLNGQRTAAALLGAWALASGVWLLRMTQLSHMSSLLALGAGAQLVAAATVVVVAGRSAAVAGKLETRPLQWLGSRSFALYLVHEPIIVSVALLAHNLLATIAIGVPVALVMAETFHVAAEHPSHRLASTIGAALQGWTPRALAGREISVTPLNKKEAVSQ
jgi:peptidoglycan/LPS O-acetylase OafA/YrhL